MCSSDLPVTVDLPEQTITRGDLVIGFEIDEYTKYRLLNSLLACTFRRAARQRTGTDGSHGGHTAELEQIST